MHITHLHTKDAVPSQSLSLEVFDIIDLPINDGPEATILIVVLQVSFSDKRHLLVVLGTRSVEKETCMETGHYTRNQTFKERRVGT